MPQVVVDLGSGGVTGRLSKLRPVNAMFCFAAAASQPYFARDDPRFTSTLRRGWNIAIWPLTPISRRWTIPQCAMRWRAYRSATSV